MRLFFLVKSCYIRRCIFAFFTLRQYVFIICYCRNHSIYELTICFGMLQNQFYPPWPIDNKDTWSLSNFSQIWLIFCHKINDIPCPMQKCLYFIDPTTIIPEIIMFEIEIEKQSSFERPSQVRTDFISLESIKHSFCVHTEEAKRIPKNSVLCDVLMMSIIFIIFWIYIMY